MRYMLLLYQNEQEAEKHAEQDLPAWFKFTDELKSAGKLIAGEALQPTVTATSLRQQSGEILTVDGPFAETKEAFIGFYMISARDLDEALIWAKKVPNVPRGGTVEIRPIMEFDAPGD